MLKNRKMFWDLKATIHLPIPTKYLWLFDLIMQEKNKTRSEVLVELLEATKDKEEYKKEWEELDKYIRGI